MRGMAIKSWNSFSFWRQLILSISESSLICSFIVCSINIYSVPNIWWAFFRHFQQVPWSFWKNITIEHTIPNKEFLYVQSVYRLFLFPRSTCMQGELLVITLPPNKIQWNICISLLLTGLLSQMYHETIFSIIPRNGSSC